MALHGHRRADQARAWLAEQPWAERGLVLEADVRDPARLQACADAILDAWGRIDVCAANAGVWPPGDLLLDELPAERLRQDHRDQPVRRPSSRPGRSSPRCGARARAPTATAAALVFTGSTAGRFGERGHTDYAAAKAGLAGRGAVPQERDRPPGPQRGGSTSWSRDGP